MSANNLKKALYARTTGFAGLSALVGNRIYPKRFPQGVTFPAISYFRVSGARTHSVRGGSGLASPRFQFDIYAETDESADLVADQLRLALDGFRGTVSGVKIRGIRLLGDQDFYESDTELHRVSMDFEVNHAETKTGAAAL